ncbi:phosphohydrolase [Methylorubrum populi]|nr:phosphohydrolase [Methylorubrum populi]
MSGATENHATRLLAEQAAALPAWRQREAFYARQEAARRPEVAEHAYTVAVLAWKLAEALKVHPVVASEIYDAARMHDIGKLAVDDAILYKPGRLDPAEADEMRLHAAYGAELLSVEGAPPLYAEIARYHHERYDGHGYHALKGEDIPLAARIVQIADVYEALTARRAYKAPMPSEDALLAMAADVPSPGFGRRSFDPGYLRVFVRLRLESDPSLSLESLAGPGGAARREKVRTLREFAGSDPMLDFAPGELPEGLVLKASGARLLYELDGGGAKVRMLALVQPNGAVVGGMAAEHLRAALSSPPPEADPAPSYRAA